jgi:hypothetical protein
MGAALSSSKTSTTMPDEVSELSEALATLTVSETPRFKEAKRQAIVRDPRSPPLGYALFMGHPIR